MYLCIFITHLGQDTLASKALWECVSGWNVSCVDVVSERLPSSITIQIPASSIDALLWLKCLGLHHAFCLDGEVPCRRTVPSIGC